MKRLYPSGIIKKESSQVKGDGQDTYVV